MNVPRFTEKCACTFLFKHPIRIRKSSGGEGSNTGKILPMEHDVIVGYVMYNTLYVEYRQISI